MGNFKEDRERRDLLIQAYHERKNYAEGWVAKIKAESISPEKRAVGLKAWEDCIQAIVRYPYEVAENWEKLYFSELWEIVIQDRGLSNMIYMGICQLRGGIIERRNLAGLPVLHADMKGLAYGRDSKDYQEWSLLNELENGLHDAFRQDQPKQTAAPAEEQEARQDSIPGGFVGFCYSKICELPETTRTAFLAINKGDSSFYYFRDRWKADFVKPVKNPEQGISKAKALYRDLNKN